MGTNSARECRCSRVWKWWLSRFLKTHARTSGQLIELIYNTRGCDGCGTGQWRLSDLEIKGAENRLYDFQFPGTHKELRLRSSLEHFIETDAIRALSPTASSDRFHPFQLSPFLPALTKPRLAVSMKVTKASTSWVIGLPRISAMAWLVFNPLRYSVRYAE